tara:strand:+ start:53582 stop:53875 length:294 start_codon:yes stop_codon:yes gene_type:complete
MPYSHPTSNTTPARFLAVLALLFMLGAQVLESAHNHPADESTSTCVLAHSGAGTALPVSIPSLPVIVAIGILLVLRTPAKLSAVSTAHLPRGPPSNT